MSGSPLKTKNLTKREKRDAQTYSQTILEYGLIVVRIIVIGVGLLHVAVFFSSFDVAP